MIFNEIIGSSGVLIILFFVLFIFLLPIVALVDIVRSRFEGNMQLIWVLIVLLLNFMGALLYFFIGRKQKVND